MRKKLLFKLLAMCLFVGTANAQLSDFYEESFESMTFPPTGWQQVSVAGTGTWIRSTDLAQSGVASAFISYDATAGEDWLITPQFDVTATTDSLIFWMAADFSGFAPDSLIIRLSTTDDQLNSFTNTLLSLEEGVNYPTAANTWVRFSVSLETYVGQQVYIAFSHYNEDGDGVFVDDVAIGTRPDNDVLPYSIDVATTIAAAAFTPQGTVRNTGLLAQTFDVQLSDGASYTSVKTVTALAPGDVATVTFDPWTPAVGANNLEMITQLTGDEIPENDTLTKAINGMKQFASLGWSAGPNQSSPTWATAPVFSDPCVSGADTGRIFVVSGADAAFNNSTANSSYNLVTNTWETNAPIPTSRTQITPIQANDKIYVIGGYGGSFSPVTNVDIYDIMTDTWTTGTALPSAVGDYGAFLYQDSLIYIVGGYSGSVDVNTVQIYNINSNSWTTGTAKTGTAVSGGRAGVSGNTIVFVGGYNQTFGQLADSYTGEIDPADPMQITWTAIADYPAGPVGRHAAGTTVRDNGMVYFGGGDPDGAGVSVLDSVYAYNTQTDLWEVGPSMLHAVSNISAFTAVVRNDTSFLVTTGGYDGIGVPGYVEWLAIEKMSYMETADTTICSGSDVTLSAMNGTSYTWTADPTLSSTTIANPVASPTANTTYYVQVQPKFGCPVMDSVSVSLVVITATAENDTIISGCTGELMVSATGGSGPYTYLWDDPASQNTQTAVLLCEGEYSVIVTDAGGCTDTVTAEVITFVGITENGAINVSIYPNPATDAITVRLPQNSGIEQVSLKDVSGKALLTKNISQSVTDTQLDLSTLPAGMYFLEFDGVAGHFTRAITKH